MPQVVFSQPATFSAWVEPRRAGALLEFQITGQSTRTVTTDANGEASVTVIDNQGAYDGTITVRALESCCYKLNGVTREWVGSQVGTSVTVDPITAAFNAQPTMTARMTPAKPNAVVTFMIDGVVRGTGTTNTQGVATALLTSAHNPGSYTLTASVSQNAFFFASTSPGAVLSISN